VEKQSRTEDDHRDADERHYDYEKDALERERVRENMPIFLTEPQWWILRKCTSQEYVSRNVPCDIKCAGCLTNAYSG